MRTLVALLALSSPCALSLTPHHHQPALRPRVQLRAAVSASAPPAAIPLKLAVAAAIACQGALQHGIQTGMLNVPQQAIASSLNISPTSVAFSAAVSVFCAGGLAGAQAAGGIATRGGRKALLGASGIWCLLGGLVQFGSGLLASKSASTAALAALIGGRLISGVGCGMATVGVPLYLGEAAPTEQRGALGSLNQLGICIGILVAQVLGALAQGRVHWRYLLGLPALLGALQLLTLPLLAESPKWLATQDGAVAASLRRLRAPGADVDAEAAALRSEVAASPPPPPSGGANAASGGQGGGKGRGGGIWSDRSLRLPLTVAGMMMVGQQWSGINAVFFYSTGFFAAAGLSNPVLGTLLASGVNAVASALSVPLMERAGRKALLLTGAGGMLGSGLVLTAALLLKAGGGVVLGLPLGGALDMLSILAVLCFVSFFELGPGPIPWQIGSEIFPEEPRAAAMGAAAVLNWVLNAAVGLGFPLLQAGLGPLAFAPFCAVLAYWLYFIRRYVPETQAKPIAEIQAEFAAISAGAMPK